jgi:cyclophilin family peptidyl-prolyl cis-trans isomerase
VCSSYLNNTVGAARFIELVNQGFYSNIPLFRAIESFLTQFGISEDPEFEHWHNDEIEDDPNLGLGIKKYYMSFAGSGRNSRATQVFIAAEDLDFLGKDPWETPFGEVIEGFEAVAEFYTGYGDGKSITVSSRYILLIDLFIACEL